MVTSNSVPGRPAREDELHSRLMKTLDGGPTAIDDRLREIECVVEPQSPSVSATILAGGERILQKLFGTGQPPDRAAGGAATPLGPLEVERERIALRALRGDFQNLPTVHQIEDRQATARMEGEGGIVVEHEDAKTDQAEAVEAVIQATAK